MCSKWLFYVTQFFMYEYLFFAQPLDFCSLFKVRHDMCAFSMTSIESTEKSLDSFNKLLNF